MSKKDNNRVSILIRGVPRALRQRFKAACEFRGSYMSREIIRLMERATAKIERDNPELTVQPECRNNNEATILEVTP